MIYWIALPIALLASAGWTVSAIVRPAEAQSWLMAAAAWGFTLLTGWRLWLNRRSLGKAGPLPPVKRLVRVFLPLTALALIGVLLAAMGVACVVAGGWLLSGASPDAFAAGYPAFEVLALIGAGLVAVLIGMWLTVPLIRRLRYRPADAPDA